jgi:hypothetical protein
LDKNFIYHRSPSCAGEIQDYINSKFGKADLKLLAEEINGMLMARSTLVARLYLRKGANFLSPVRLAFKPGLILDGEVTTSCKIIAEAVMQQIDVL